MYTMAFYLARKVNQRQDRVRISSTDTFPSAQWSVATDSIYSAEHRLGGLWL